MPTPQAAGKLQERRRPRPQRRAPLRMLALLRLKMWPNRSPLSLRGMTVQRQPSRPRKIQSKTWLHPTTTSQRNPFPPQEPNNWLNRAPSRPPFLQNS